MLIRIVKKVGYSVGLFSVPIAFFDQIGHPMYIHGNSMEPTLLGSSTKWWKNDFVWLSKLHQMPEIGHIYMFISPINPNSKHIKRVAKGPGDMVRTKSGALFKVPENFYWMISDKDDVQKLDSIVFGPVNRGLIKGRATRILWPPRRWKRL